MRTRTHPWAGSVAAVLLLAIGCSSHPPSPSLARNTDLAALTVLGGCGDLVPAFHPGLAAYHLPPLCAGDPGPIQIVAVAEDPEATLTINGTPARSGIPVGPIPLAEGPNLIPVTVTSRDGATTRTTTLSYLIHPRNTQIQVLDSINGSPVPGARITVAEAGGKVLQRNIPADAQGVASLRLDGKSRYDLSAEADGTAQSLYAGFDSSREKEAAFYCHPLGMLPYPALAPRITALAYGPGDSSWTPVEGDIIRDSLLHIAALKITLESGCAINPMPSTGFGLRLDVDRSAWSWADWGAPPAVLEPPTPVASGSPALYRTTLSLEIPHTQAGQDPDHVLDLVAYDIAKNRTETRLYVTVTGATGPSAMPDISALKPSDVSLAFVTCGLSQELFSMGGGNPISHLHELEFSLRSADGDPVPVTGYEISRSRDGALWTRVAGSRFSAPKMAERLVYTGSDPSMKEGETYLYRVRALNDAGPSLDSDPIPCAFMPPFTASLASPPSGTLCRTLKPSFAFTISNPSLFDAAVSDFFYFTLFLHDKALDPSTYSQPYRYTFAQGRFEFYENEAWLDAGDAVTVDAAHRTFTILAPEGFLQPGASYDWSVFGRRGDLSGQNSDPCKFEKLTHAGPGADSPDPAPDGQGNMALSLSLGSTYERGYGAINGFFTLNIDPNAH